MATRTQKSPLSPPEVDLPPVTDQEREAVLTQLEPPRYASSTITTRYHDPQTGRTFVISFADLDLGALEVFCDSIERNGYVPCLAPDAPQPASSERAAAPPTDRRAGQRDQRPKGKRLLVPFGKYKGSSLLDIEASDPNYIDWLAENATMNDIRRAAGLIVEQRDDDDMPF